MKIKRDEFIKYFLSYIQLELTKKLPCEDDEKIMIELSCQVVRGDTSHILLDINEVQNEQIAKDS